MAEEKQVGNLKKESHFYHDITWNIPDFFTLPSEVGYFVDSPPFAAADATWCLRIYPNGKEDRGSSGYVDFQIARLHSDVTDHEVSYYLAIKRNDHENYEDFRSTMFFLESSAENGVSCFVKSSRLLNEARDSTLTFFCQMRIVSQGIAGDHAAIQNGHSEALPSSEDEIVPKTPKSIDNLCENFKSVLLNGQNHDLTLKVVDTEFRAHQDILRARSQVFHSMLSHDMAEKNSGVISIPDCDPAAFEQFLTFIYSGKVDKMDESNMLGLYYVADKYDMEDLKEECREFIQKSLSTRVVCDVIDLASSHSDSELLGCSMEYFTRNIEEILPTVEWQLFLKDNATKANEVLIQATKKLIYKQ